MTSKQLQLAIIIGSTRRRRFGPTAGTWFAGRAAQHQGFGIDLIDLADGALPAVLNDFGDPTPGPVEELGTRLAAADAFVVVTPEYNHSYPSSLKLAIDWFRDEWQAKPVGFVSYGGISGGLRAVEHLRTVFAEMHAVTIRETVSFHDFHRAFGPDGQPVDGEVTGAAAKRLLDQLTWWAQALHDHRADHPYGR